MGARVRALLLALLLWLVGLEQLESQAANRIPGPWNTELLSDSCGDRDTTSLIVGGVESARGRWPWLGSVRFENHHACAGSLLSRRWVLSAAHCFEKYNNPFDWTVQFGEVTSKPWFWNPWTYSNLYKVVDIIINPKYVRAFHDIALLRLDSSVSFNQYVQPICVLSSNSKFLHRPDCWVAGWGVLDENQTALPPPYSLREAQVTVLNNTRCNYLYSQYSFQSLFSEFSFCAGSEDGKVDTCSGDSGGPLVCDQDGLWYQVGIVSWGDGCGRPNRPGVYTNVSFFFHWIQMQMSHSALGPEPSRPLLLALLWAHRLLRTA